MAESQIGHGPTLAAQPGVPGERLAAGAPAGDYVVDRFLGAGAMGEVYAGHHPVIGKRVAIKVLKRELGSSAEAAERFIREARAVNQVDHPNVIDVFGFGRLGDGRLYLAMDLVDGRTLREAARGAALDVATILDLLAQVASALDAAHGRGVVHRDLKPDNVMISDATPPKVYVLDFGIAKLFSETSPLGNGTLTGQGAWLGTPGYMAPEQWSADGAGPASDRYALGVMAFELLAGKLPFQAPSLPQMMEQHFRAPVPALSARGAVASHAAFDPVLSRAMAKDPAHRYATATALVDALRAAADTPTTGRRRDRAAVPGRTWIPAAAGVGVLGLAAVAVIATRDGDRVVERAPPRSPPAGFARVEVATRPAQATVRRGGRLVGSTPASFDARLGEPLALELAKPGYTTVWRTVDPTPAGNQLDVTLQPQNGFEGVWALPDGQLRAFARAGEQVHLFKLEVVTGEREFFRTLALAEAPPGEVVLVATETLSDERAERAASCQIAHRIEYHYATKTDVLDVRAENIETAIRDGRCIVVDKQPGRPIVLVRADRAPGDTRWSHAPAGVPTDQPNDVEHKPIPVRPSRTKQPKQILRPPPPRTDPTPNRAPPPPPPQPDPPAQLSPQQQGQVPPRGDAQVAPPVRDPDTSTQQRPSKPSRKP